MTYKLVDLNTQTVLGTYGTEAQARKAESRLDHEYGETAYEIQVPEVKKTRTKKNVKKEGN